jgi:hypothetical protein
MNEQPKQQYGGITDPDALAWLERNYPPRPKPDNTRAEAEEQGRGVSLWQSK